MKKKPAAEVYRLKRELSGAMERLSEDGTIDLYYGDEAGGALEPNCRMAGSLRMKPWRCRLRKAQASIVSDCRGDQTKVGRL